MNSPSPVWFHSSQQLPAIETARRESLLTNRIHHQFHYATAQQSHLWQEVFKQHAPVNRLKSFEQIYRDLFLEVAGKTREKAVHVIGLGTGTGIKDTWLLEELKARNPGIGIFFTPVDVSPYLALLSGERSSSLATETIHPLVCDLPRFPGLPDWLSSFDNQVPRIFTFFGMLPNFQPETVLPLLHSWLRPADCVLISANLAPVPDDTGESYRAGCNKILPQYDNPEVRAWLSAVLQDWGIAQWLEPLSVTTGPIGDLHGIVAQAKWKTSRTLDWEGTSITVEEGAALDVFFSIRYTPDLLSKTLTRHDLKTIAGYVTPCGEEAVWEIGPS